MQKFIERSVAGAFAIVGGWLVGTGVVTPEGWAGATSPEVVVGISGLVTVVVYGAVNWATMVAMDLFKGQKTVEVKVDTASGAVKEVSK